MEITLHINANDINDREKVLEVVREAIIGTLFLKMKLERDDQYENGFITAAEYARMLASDAADAYEAVSNLR